MALKFPVTADVDSSTCFLDTPASFTYATGATLIMWVRRDVAFTDGALLCFKQDGEATDHVVEVNSSGVVQGKINWFATTMASNGTLVEDEWAQIALTVRVDAGTPKLRICMKVGATFVAQEASGATLGDTTGNWFFSIGGFRNAGPSYYRPSKSSLCLVQVYSIYMNDATIEARMADQLPDAGSLYSFNSMNNKADTAACLSKGTGAGSDWIQRGSGQVLDDAANPLFAIVSALKSFYHRIGPTLRDFLNVGYRAGIDSAAGSIVHGTRYAVMLSIKPEAGLVVASVTGVELFRLHADGQSYVLRLVVVAGTSWELRVRSSTVAGGLVAETVVATISTITAGAIYRFILDMTPHWSPAGGPRLKAYMQKNNDALAEICNVTTPFGYEQSSTMTFKHEILYTNATYAIAQTKIDYKSKGLYIMRWLPGVPTLTTTVLLDTLRAM